MQGERTPFAEIADERLDAVAGGFRRNNLGLFTLNIGTVE